MSRAYVFWRQGPKPVERDLLYVSSNDDLWFSARAEACRVLKTDPYALVWETVSAEVAEQMRAKQWVLYILECADGSLYTGITNDFDRRVKQHNAGDGAKYTRSRCPVVPVLRLRHPTMGHQVWASWEVRVKRLTRKQKEEFIRGEGKLWESLYHTQPGLEVTRYGNDEAAGSSTCAT